jgi:hypothetical protein
VLEREVLAELADVAHDATTRRSALERITKSKKTRPARVHGASRKTR